MTSQSTNLVFEGKLLKRGKLNKAWKERWFLLYNTLILEYYPSKSDAQKNSNMCGAVDISQTFAIDAITEYSIILEKELPGKVKINRSLKSDRKYTFQLILESRTYIFAALDAKNFFIWINYLNECIFGGVIKHGYMLKMGAVNKSWKKRYFVMNKYQQLKYYENKNARKHLGIIDLKCVQSIDIGQSFSVQLICTENTFGKTMNYSVFP